MPQDKKDEQRDEIAALREELAELKALLASPSAPKPVKEHVPVWKKHRVRAIGRGAANHRTYEAGEEFDHVLDSAATPASWYELLDEGVPSKAPNTALGAFDFAKAETPRTQSGFAAGQSGSVL